MEERMSQQAGRDEQQHLIIPTSFRDADFKNTVTPVMALLRTHGIKAPVSIGTSSGEYVKDITLSVGLRKFIGPAAIQEYISRELRK